MQELIKRFLDQGLSRRGLIQKLSALGIGMAQAQSLLEALQVSEEAGKGLPVPGSTTVKGTGGELLMAQVKAAGSDYFFCNPGSFEVGLYDAQVTSGVPLVMGLHEGIAISMADGYHRSSLRPAFVNIHVISGTAQALGQLYNCSRDGSSLVVTAGLLDNEVWSDDGNLMPRPGYDQKEVPRQFTKICWEARNSASLPLMLRRAYKTSMTSPGGPTYLAVTQEALQEESEAQILPGERFLFHSHPRPETAAVEQAAKWLITAKRPLIVVGDEVWKSRAGDELVAFAHKFGLPVASGNQGFRNYPTRDPLHIGNFSMNSPYVKPGVDLVIMVGARDFGARVVPDSPEAPNARVVRIGMDTNAMGRNYQTDLAIVCDVKAGIKDLQAALEGMLSKQRLMDFGKTRGEEVKGIASKMWADRDAGLRANFGKAEMHPDELTYIMAKTAGNAMIVSEVHSSVARYDHFHFSHRPEDPMWMTYTSNGLGWGMGAATGAKLGQPDRTVICSIGDGAVMYQSSALWTQARYGIPVLNVVWTNRDYETVRLGYSRYGRNMAKTGHYAGMYLGEPDIDYVQLGECQGVKGEKANNQSEFEAAMKRGIQQTKDGNPYVIQAAICRTGGGAESTWHEGFKLTELMKKGRQA
jgi:thiamine pyrophosphate-dependent acetolactate synthase large subunit-like protein